MKTFFCQCENRLHFENSSCLVCGRLVGFLPDRHRLGGLDPESEGLWRWQDPSGVQGRYRMCVNYHKYKVCNWMVVENDPLPYCLSCRLNHIIPNLTQPNNLTLWYRIEKAKRRLLYTLVMLKLPIVGRDVDPEHGLAFEFLADPDSNEEFTDEAGKGTRVLTGHRSGMITINIAEAESSQLEKMREKMKERYRTLLGHFRHESAHYYWDRLIQDTPRIAAFRELFGDERMDYSKALETYYRQKKPNHWQEDWVSTYASSHPWEDWAETWAHYLHMVDTLETAHDFSFSFEGKPLASAVPTQANAGYFPFVSFENLMVDWGTLTLALNALNRSMGLSDAYPFALSQKVQGKLHFVHHCIRER